MISKKDMVCLNWSFLSEFLNADKLLQALLFVDSISSQTLCLLEWRQN